MLDDLSNSLGALRVLRAVEPDFRGCYDEHEEKSESCLLRYEESLKYAKSFIPPEVDLDAEEMDDAEDSDDEHNKEGIASSDPNSAPVTHAKKTESDTAVPSTEQIIASVAEDVGGLKEDVKAE